MLNTSPSNHMMINCSESPSALLRLKFSMIWGLKTTTHAAMEMELDRRRIDQPSFGVEFWS
jgi:hypothetical protein